MARPDKAQIKYTNDGADTILRFHSVVAEEHEVSSQITKFPVQSRFNVSNHAIRMNRSVSITGLISNNQVVGSEEFHNYGVNNIRIMFDTLKEIVRGAVPCEVTTNFGNYSPVLFTKFRTKLMAGKTDMMEFTMRGEEIQLSTSVNGSKPSLVTWLPLTDEQRKAEADRLITAGIDVPDDAYFEQCTVDMNESFQLESIDSVGNTSITTYVNVGTDPTTGNILHEVHTTATEVHDELTETAISWKEVIEEEAAALGLPEVDLDAALSTASACLQSELIGLATEEVSEFTNTALGSLKKSVYGVVYDTLGVNGDQSFGQQLLSIGTDCVVAGAMGSVGLTDADSFDTSLPSVDDVLEGAEKLGNQAATDYIGVSAPTTLTKITSISEDAQLFGG